MIIKCKMCGGDLHPEIGGTTCECEFCGTVQTIPTDDGEKKTNLFNRANRLRMNAEFDKASAVYESIAAEFPEEAEAYWGLCLCSYGIEYVDDPTTGEKKPTCHRTLPTSIMEDSNFEQACDNADAIARRVYREEAKAIDRIQKDILSIVSSEEPYDVFICYKETTEEGGRTEDSVLAQEIYDALTEKGLKVFFSRITLEDKLGQQYEPYIYSALSSAKVMLAVGTKFEYYDAVWVKNEWMRFLSMMKTEKGKTLIPCYKSLDAYDMPKEFKNLQGQDMSKLGWLQDLTRGVMKICGKEKNVDTASQQQTRGQTNSPTVDSLIKRAFVFLEDKEWDSAREYADKVLDINVENAQAYLVKLMADLKVSKREELKEQEKPFGQNENCQKIFRFGDDSIIQEIRDIIIYINDRNETNRKKKEDAEKRISEFEIRLKEAKEACTQADKSIEEAKRRKEKASSELQRLESEVKTLSSEVERLTGFFNRKRKAEVEERISYLQTNVKRVQDDLKHAEEQLLSAQENKPEPPDNEMVYQLALSYCDAGRYSDAYKYFASIRGYKDVDELLMNNEGLKSVAVHESIIAPYKVVGNEVHFGHYNLGGRPENKDEELPWIVLETKANKSLLICKYGIDAIPYHNIATSIVTWEQSSLRQWLNTDFFNKGFSVEEQNAISETIVDNSESHGNNNNIDLSSVGMRTKVVNGNNTFDRVFLLSYKEARKYYTSDSSRLCKASEYTKQKGNSIYSPGAPGIPEKAGKRNGIGRWWLRSGHYLYSQLPSDNDIIMLGEIIEEDGKFEGVAVTNALMIRPVIWIELDSEYFRSIKACDEAHDDILTKQKMKLDEIINSLSECARAQEMVQRFETMKSSCDDATYQQVLDVLKGRAQVERMYGVNHAQTVKALNELR